MQEFLPNTYPIGATNPCPACPAGFVYLTSDGSSRRDAGQLQLRRRLRNGLTASVQYTFAKATDDAAAAFTGASIDGSAIAQDWRDLDGRARTVELRSAPPAGGTVPGTQPGWASAAAPCIWFAANALERLDFHGTVEHRQRTSADADLPRTGSRHRRHRERFGPASPAPRADAPPGLYREPGRLRRPCRRSVGQRRPQLDPRSGARSRSTPASARSFPWGPRVTFDWRVEATNVLNRVTYTGVNVTDRQPAIRSAPSRRTRCGSCRAVCGSGSEVINRQRFGVPGSGFRVSRSGFRVPGSGFRVSDRLEVRGSRFRCGAGCGSVRMLASGSSSRLVAGIAQQAPVFRSDARLTIVDVTVTDKQGRPVEGLTADDFTITEDGEPQSISSSHFSAWRRVTDPARAELAPPPVRAARAAAAVQPTISAPIARRRPVPRPAAARPVLRPDRDAAARSDARLQRGAQVHRRADEGAGSHRGHDVPGRRRAREAGLHRRPRRRCATRSQTLIFGDDSATATAFPMRRPTSARRSDRTMRSSTS